MGKLRHWNIKWLPDGHTWNQWQSWSEGSGAPILSPLLQRLGKIASYTSLKLALSKSIKYRNILEVRCWLPLNVCIKELEDTDTLYSWIEGNRFSHACPPWTWSKAHWKQWKDSHWLMQPLAQVPWLPGSGEPYCWPIPKRGTVRACQGSWLSVHWLAVRSWH